MDAKNPSLAKRNFDLIRSLIVKAITTKNPNLVASSLQQLSRLEKQYPHYATRHHQELSDLREKLDVIPKDIKSTSFNGQEISVGRTLSTTGNTYTLTAIKEHLGSEIFVLVDPAGTIYNAPKNDLETLETAEQLESYLQESITKSDALQEETPPALQVAPKKIQPETPHQAPYTQENPEDPRLDTLLREVFPSEEDGSIPLWEELLTFDPLQPILFKTKQGMKKIPMNASFFVNPKLHHVMISPEYTKFQERIVLLSKITGTKPEHNESITSFTYRLVQDGM